MVEILTVICTAAVTTLITLWAAKKINSGSHDTQRKLTTIMHLLEKHWDSDYLESKTIFNSLKKANGGLRKYADSTEPADEERVQHVRAVLNDYELVSLGIVEGLLDGETYGKWFKSSFLADYRAASEYIQVVQVRNPEAYVQMKRLAEEWAEADPKK